MCSPEQTNKETMKRSTKRNEKRDKQNRKQTVQYSELVPGDGANFLDHADHGRVAAHVDLVGGQTQQRAACACGTNKTEQTRQSDTEKAKQRQTEKQSDC